MIPIHNRQKMTYASNKSSHFFKFYFAGKRTQPSSSPFDIRMVRNVSVRLPRRTSDEPRAQGRPSLRLGRRRQQHGGGRSARGDLPGAAHAAGEADPAGTVRGLPSLYTLRFHHVQRVCFKPGKGDMMYKSNTKW